MPRREAPPIRSWLPHVLWVDGLAGLSAGVIVLTLRQVLASLYGLPLEVITFVGFVNLAYAPVGLTLAPRARRPVAAIVALAAANGLWACTCVALAVRYGLRATTLGLATLLCEAVIVAGLAVVEWRYRRELAARVFTLTRSS